MKKLLEKDKLLKQEAKKLKELQKGKSNKEILAEIDLKNNLKLNKNTIQLNEFFGISGIYFLFKENKLVYIGESSCVFTRISQHFKNTKKEFDSFKYEIFQGTIKQRKLKERKLIIRYNPILNFIHNTALTLN